MEKVIRNGEVAVLISKGFGAGWYSWHSNLEINWLATGTRFIIEEYDGAESLRTIDDLSLIA